MRPSPARDRLPVSLFVIMIHAVLTQGTVFVVRPTISYRALEIGLSGAMIGVLAGAFTVMPLLVALQIGRATDRFGERRLMLAGTAGMAAAVLVLLRAGSDLTILVVASVLLGVAHLGAAVGQQAMVGRIVPASRFAAGFGYYTLTGSIGQAAAPGLIALFGASRTIPDTQAIFRVTLGVVCLALVVPLLLPKDVARPGAVHRGTRAVGALLRIRGLPTAVVVSGVVLAAIDVLTVYLPVLGAERGYSAGLVSLLLVIRASASLCSRVFLEPLQDRAGSNRLLVGTVGLSCVVMGVVPAVPQVWLLCVLMVPLGVGLGLAQPITMAWVAAISPPGTRGSAMSLRLTGNRLGQTLMPVVAGGAAASLGTAGVLWVVALFLGAATASALRVDISVDPDDDPHRSGDAEGP